MKYILNGYGQKEKKRVKPKQMEKCFKILKKNQKNKNIA